MWHGCSKASAVSGRFQLRRPPHCHTTHPHYRHLFSACVYEEGGRGREGGRDLGPPQRAALEGVGSARRGERRQVRDRRAGGGEPPRAEIHRVAASALVEVPVPAFVRALPRRGAGRRPNPFEVGRAAGAVTRVAHPRNQDDKRSDWCCSRVGRQRRWRRRAGRGRLAFRVVAAGAVAVIRRAVCGAGTRAVAAAALGIAVLEAGVVVVAP